MTIEEILSQHVKFDRRGKEFVFLCPFHEEKTPSCSMNMYTGMFHCFGCKKGGSLNSFLTFLGAEKGADTLAGCWARENNIKEKQCPALWNTHGKAAGSIRNQQMLDSNTVELVVAFPGGKGTSDMVSRAKKSGIEVKEIQNE